MITKWYVKLLKDPTTAQGRAGKIIRDDIYCREFLFLLQLIPAVSVGIPEEPSKTTHHRLKVVVERHLFISWNLYEEDSAKDLMKLAFMLAKMELEKRLAKGELKQEETVQLDTLNYENPCPVNPAKIPEPVDKVFEMEVERTIGFNCY